MEQLTCDIYNPFLKFKTKKYNEYYWSHWDYYIDYMSGHYYGTESSNFSWNKNGQVPIEYVAKRR